MAKATKSADKKKAAVKKKPPTLRKIRKLAQSLDDYDEHTGATIHSEDGETIPCAVNEREEE